MDLDALALAVDELIRWPAAERRSGRLYAVRCAAGSDIGDPASEQPGSGVGSVTLELLAEGEARSLPQKVRPPAGVQAIALASGVWVAPLDDRPGLPPSQHPHRRRAHVTNLVACEGDRDAVDVSVLRYGDGAPMVMRGGMGLIHERMVRCWLRRPEAQAAVRPAGSAA
jgi:hypothetical protein